MPMIEITTRSSIKVKPLVFKFFFMGIDLDKITNHHISDNDINNDHNNQKKVDGF